MLPRVYRSPNSRFEVTEFDVVYAARSISLMVDGYFILNYHYEFKTWQEVGCHPFFVERA